MCIRLRGTEFLRHESPVKGQCLQVVFCPNAVEPICSWICLYLEDAEAPLELDCLAIAQQILCQSLGPGPMIKVGNAKGDAVVWQSHDLLWRD